MAYKYVLFDLDGTLTDPKIGITKAAQYALKKFDIHIDNLDDLEKVIGPPLKESFSNFYGLSEMDSNKAIDYFRDYFKSKGIYENIPYSNIEELLTSLKDNDMHLAVATSKPTVFAKQILEHFKLIDFFEVVVGSNLDNTRTDKAEIIEEVLNQLSVIDLSEVIMIGDRKHDLIGARKRSVDSIGVTYGYGSLEELKEENPKFIVNNVSDIKDRILQ